VRRARPRAFARRILLVLEHVFHAPPTLRFLAVFLAVSAVMMEVAALSGLVAHWAGAPDHSVSLVEGLWWALTRLLDGGTVASDTGLLPRVLGVGVTFIGLVTTSILTGAFASAFTEGLERLQSGELPAFERDHLLFLGWSPSGGVVLRELCASGVRRPVVIVSTQGRELIEEHLRGYLPPGGAAFEIVFRAGDPTTPSAVERGAARRAAAIVILPEAEPGAAEHTESVALRSLIAARRVLGDAEVPLFVESTGTAGRAMLGLCAGPERVMVVAARDLHARLLARTVRQPSVFHVARRVLSIGAHGVFAHPAGAFAGATFDEAHALAGGGVLIGVVRDGRAELCPDGSLVLRSDDRLLFLGAGGAPLRASAPLPASGPDLAPPSTRDRLDLLVLRPSPELGRVLSALDRQERVRAAVLCAPEASTTLAAAIDPAHLGLSRTTVELHTSGPGNEKTLDTLLERRWDVALLLAAPVPSALEAHADADSLLALLHVNLPQHPGAGVARALVEIRSPEVQRIARGLGVQGPFVLSREIVGLILAREIHAVVAHQDAEVQAARGVPCLDLLDDVAASVELRAVARIDGEEPPTFAHLAAAARRRGEIAIGWLEPGADGPVVKLLPARGERVALREGVEVIVLTSEEIREGGAVEAVHPR
jgi:hypothetical protein